MKENNKMQESLSKVATGKWVAMKNNRKDVNYVRKKF